MRLQNPFAAVSTTGLDSQVLTVLARIEQYLTIAQIHQLLPEEGSTQGVRNTVVRLTEQGTLLERATGRSVAYAFNRDHLLADAVLRIANAKSELVDRMRESIAEWEFAPLTVKIFGSAARNDMRSESDIDVLIVAADSVSEVVLEASVGRFASLASRWTGNDVRPLVYRSSEVGPASIFTSILEHSIDVSGEPTWLRRHVRKERTAA
ncbi:nucleotidyltransferase domain-containing protein [Subtercola endophyticus]|uniref:nucleotidyltransferase domain-containing protein n=1 Tax=Subtercola endophyticus TaxID=2895559 RepID=UPI001E59AD1A|nr:nucleotidyltransferase domain-containing protein [Subtercola endophyticus]UFS58401.1 nucleotidyltransferase domain-containing protein [Subtercola endophyticus]